MNISYLEILHKPLFSHHFGTP